MVEYRGYGLSTGVPDEAGLKVDAQTALDHLRQRAETSRSQIIVYGQSLGGAVAINLVAANEDKGDIAGLVLENTFLSIRKLIPRCVVVCYQCNNSVFWSNTKCLQRLSPCPLLGALLSSDLDKRRCAAEDHPNSYSLLEWTQGRDSPVSVTSYLKR
jgi:alpha/beta superfamily hydrolase